MAKIFYFTGTGNCYSVANRLGEKLGAELVAITDYLSHPYIVEDAVIGIVTPVYSMLCVVLQQRLSVCLVH